MAKKTKDKPEAFIPCRIVELPEDMQLEAAKVAVAENPANAPAIEMVAMFAVALADLKDVNVPEQEVLDPGRLAFLTSRYWGSRGVDLTVSFLDNPTAGLRNKILAHANAWGEFSNVKFRWTQSGGQVRIARQRNSGYWSYLGTDILSIRGNQPTMNLEGFTESTSEATFNRVVRHEFGHTLAAAHEHLRRSIVDRLDVQKTLAYFRQTQGWSDAVTRSNVLTPVEERSLLGSSHTDEDSIMAYGLPASIFKDGRGISGGDNFSTTDKEWAAKTYPKADVVDPTPPPPPPPSGKRTIVLSGATVTLSVEGGKVTIDGKEL